MRTNKQQLEEEPVTGLPALPETEDIKNVSNDLSTRVAALIVTNSEELRYGDELAKSAKRIVVEIEQRFAESKDSAWKAHKKITALEKSFLDPAKKLFDIIVSKTSSYRQAEQRRIDAETAKRDAELGKQAEAERARQAALAEFDDEPEQAEQILQQEVFVPPAAPVAEIPKTEGVTDRRTWGAEVTDIRALARAVADGTVPAEYILPNEPVLNAQARAMKDALTIPGVKAVSKVNTSYRV